MKTNENGLTLKRWLAAANFARTTKLPDHVLERGWENGEDPSEYAALPDPGRWDGERNAWIAGDSTETELDRMYQETDSRSGPAPGFAEQRWSGNKPPPERDPDDYVGDEHMAEQAALDRSIEALRAGDYALAADALRGVDPIPMGFPRLLNAIDRGIRASAARAALQPARDDNYRARFAAQREVEDADVEIDDAAFAMKDHGYRVGLLADPDKLRAWASDVVWYPNGPEEPERDQDRDRAHGAPHNPHTTATKNEVHIPPAPPSGDAIRSISRRTANVTGANPLLRLRDDANRLRQASVAAAMHASEACELGKSPADGRAERDRRKTATLDLRDHWSRAVKADTASAALAELAHASLAAREAHGSDEYERRAARMVEDGVTQTEPGWRGAHGTWNTLAIAADELARSTSAKRDSGKKVDQLGLGYLFGEPLDSEFWPKWLEKVNNATLSEATERLATDVERGVIRGGLPERLAAIRAEMTNRARARGRRR